MGSLSFSVWLIERPVTSVSREDISKSKGDVVLGITLCVKTNQTCNRFPSDLILEDELTVMVWVLLRDTKANQVSFIVFVFCYFNFIFMVECEQRNCIPLCGRPSLRTQTPAISRPAHTSKPREPISFSEFLVPTYFLFFGVVWAYLCVCV